MRSGPLPTTSASWWAAVDGPSSRCAGWWRRRLHREAASRSRSSPRASSRVRSRSDGGRPRAPAARGARRAAGRGPVGRAGALRARRGGGRGGSRLGGAAAAARGVRGPPPSGQDAGPLRRRHGRRRRRRPAGQPAVDPVGGRARARRRRVLAPPARRAGRGRRRGQRPRRRQRRAAGGRPRPARGAAARRSDRAGPCGRGPGHRGARGRPRDRGGDPGPAGPGVSEPPVRCDVVTIFPEFFDSPLQTGLLGKAVERGLLDVRRHDLRDWTHDRHRTVDDSPFGGGAGMVMRPEAWFEALDDLLEEGPARVVLLAAGETAALAVLDAIARLLPGVMGNASSAADESFAAGLLEYPQYTRPAVYRDLEVPEVLRSGNHGAIARWRREQAIERTLEVRPDLLDEADLTEEERARHGLA